MQISNVLRRCNGIVSGFVASHVVIATVYAESVIFNTSIINERGLDSNIADYFSREARFLPGRHLVALRINGKERGMVLATFNDEGNLCADEQFLADGGLKAEKRFSVATQTKNSCPDYREMFDGVQIVLLPSRERIDMVVPAEAIDMQSGSSRVYTRGGVAGMMNYSLFTLLNHYSGEVSRYSQASLEGGVNMGDWLLRSRHIMTDNDGKRQNESQYTYVQHTFVDHKKSIQAGEINARNTLLAIPAILGAQLVPEEALNADSGSGVVVEGMASTNQARVEIWQSGQLVYSTMVTAGPFRFEDVPVNSISTNLDVKVVEADGREHHFVVPAAALTGKRPARAKGMSIALGRVRDMESDYDMPIVLSASNAWTSGLRSKVNVGGLLSRRYQSAGTELSFQVSSFLRLSGRFSFSNDDYGHRRGAGTEISAFLALADNTSIFATSTQRSKNYRDLAQALNKNATVYQKDYSVGISWSEDLLGTLAFSYLMSEGRNDDDDSQSTMVSWSKSFKRASVTASWNRQVNKSGDDVFYLHLSIPFENRSIGSYIRKDGVNHRYGLQADGNISENSRYSLSYDRDWQQKNDSFNGSIYSNFHYTRLNINAGTAQHYRNYGVSLSGGVVAHDKGVTFSPYAVKDTYAVVSLGYPLRGVEIATPQGPVWTDAKGQAIVPALPEYRRARIEINNATLPGNIEVGNGTRVIAAGYASVGKVEFRVLEVNRAVIKVQHADGSPAARGSLIQDEKGNYVVTVVDDGLAFVNNLSQLKALYLAGQGGQRRCRIDYRPEQESDPQAFYARYQGVCQ